MMLHPSDEQAQHWHAIEAHPRKTGLVWTLLTVVIGGAVLAAGMWAVFL